MLMIILAFLGTLVAIGIVGGIVYAVVTKKKPSADWLKVTAVILGVVFIVGLSIWLVGKDLSAPSLATVNAWRQHFWLWILIFSVFVYVEASFIPKSAATLADTLKTVLALMVVTLFIVFPILGMFSGGSGDSQATSSAREERPMNSLVLPANGYSEHVNAPVGYFVRFHGHGYTVHCVYSDGHEGVVGDQSRPCEDGPTLYWYLQDTTGAPNMVPYERVRSF